MVPRTLGSHAHGLAGGGKASGLAVEDRASARELGARDAGDGALRASDGGGLGHHGDGSREGDGRHGYMLDFVKGYEEW
eukprot:1191150-Prorocentrum_minimum.AAC.5